MVKKQGPFRAPKTDPLVLSVLKEIVITLFEAVGEAEDLKAVAVADGPDL